MPILYQNAEVKVEYGEENQKDRVLYILTLDDSVLVGRVRGGEEELERAKKIADSYEKYN